MVELNRRHVLALAAVGLVAAGCAPVAPRPTPTPTPVGPPDWSALAGRLTGALALPGDPSYGTVKLTENPRWDAAMPLAVLSAANAADVARGLAFARKYGLPIALRSGGHNYPGYSAGGAPGTGVPPSLIIDTRGIDTVTLAANGQATIGAGASLAQVYDTLGNQGRAIAGGSCATVGIAGLTLGGGIGVLARAYGLTCDSLAEVTIVTADGVVRTANSTTNPDLYWACRGGGGGHLGVVTSLTFDTVAAPQVTMFSLSWPFADAASVITAWQAWAPTADPQLWSTLKLLNGPKYGSAPGLFVSGTWLGAPAALDAQFAPFFAAAGAPASNLRGTHSYHDAMMSYAGCASIPIAQCTTAPGGQLVRESFGATSHIANAPLNPAGVQQVIAQVVAAGSLPGVREAGISMDALGGAVGNLAPSATAFPHRSALASIQYTATFPDGTDPAPLDAYVRGFRAAMTPYWGEGAYVNYSDATLTDPLASYFAANAKRLGRVRAKYDPDGVFTQPQSF
ncbi:MAG: FAD-dependent oxidoreductase [Galbitalea sp.]